MDAPAAVPGPQRATFTPQYVPLTTDLGLEVYPGTRLVFSVYSADSDLASPQTIAVTVPDADVWDLLTMLEGAAAGGYPLSPRRGLDRLFRRRPQQPCLLQLVVSPSLTVIVNAEPCGHRVTFILPSHHFASFVLPGDGLARLIDAIRDGRNAINAAAFEAIMADVARRNEEARQDAAGLEQHEHLVKLTGRPPTPPELN